MKMQHDAAGDIAAASYKLTIRFGDEILQAGFTSVPNLFLRYQARLNINAAELNFILQVWYHWWSDQDPYPSLATIGMRMGLSRRQVRRYSESLRDKGLLIVRERTTQGHGQVTSEYDFTPLLTQLRSLYQSEQSHNSPPRFPLRTDLTDLPRTNLTEGGRTNLTEDPRSRMSPEEYSVEEDSEQQYVGVVNAAAEHFSDAARAGDSAAVIQALTKFGITRKVAERYSRAYPPAYLLAKLDLCSWLVDTKSPLAAKNPAGYLRRAIEDDYAPPAEFVPKAQREAKEQERRRKTERVAAQLQRQEKAQEHARLAAQNARRRAFAGQPIIGTDLTTTEAWKTILERLEQELSRGNYALVAPSILVEVDGETALIAFPSDFAREYAETRLTSTLRRLLIETLGRSVKVEFITVTDEEIAMEMTPPARRRGRPPKSAAKNQPAAAAETNPPGTGRLL